MPQVLIYGYYGFGNPGDEIILQVLLKDLRHVMDDVEPVVLSGDPESTRMLHGVASIGLADADGLARVLKETSLVVVGGGGLFQDYWNPKLEDVISSRQFGLSQIAGLGALATLAGIPFILYGVGVGPIQERESELLTQAIFDCASLIVVRDRYSMRSAAEVLKDPNDPRLILGSDLAFRYSVRNHSASRPVDLRLGGSTTKPRLGVNLRYWDIHLDFDVLLTVMAEGLNDWASKSGGSIELIPFQAVDGSTYEDDLSVLRELQTRLSTDVSVKLLQPFGWRDPVARITRQDLFIAMRYHAALLPLMSGIPGLLVGYDPKCGSLANDLGVEDWLKDADKLTPDWIGRQLSSMEQQASIGLASVRQNLAGLRGRGRSALDSVNEQLQSGLVPRNTPDLLRALLVDRSLAGQIGPRIIEGVDVQGLRESLRVAQEVNRRQTHELLEMEHEVVRLKSHAGRLETRLESVEKERDLARESGERTRRRYSQLQAVNTAVRSTIGFRMLSMYWRLGKRLIPEGSLRRKLYFRVVTLFKRLARRGFLPGRVPGFLKVGSIEPAAGSDQWDEAAISTFHRFVDETWSSNERRLLIMSPIDPLQEPGQRAAGLAREWTRLGVPVLFAYWRWSRDFPPDLDPDGQMLSIPLDMLLDRGSPMYQTLLPERGTVLFEFPFPGFFDFLAMANARGWVTVYDVIDNWNAFHQAGQAPWYDRAFEEHLIGAADLVVASSRHLVERVRRLTSVEPTLLPNAASSAVGMPPGSLDGVDDPTTVGFFGSLSGAWFDWNLIREVAVRKPRWKFELVGQADQAAGVRLPPNISLLGPAPQGELGKIAQHWDAAMAPFIESPLAEFVDPIKVYEYLKLGLPVVMTGAYSPVGAEHLVSRVSGIGSFIKALEAQVMNGPKGRESRVKFGRSNTWKHRAESLTSMLATGSQRVREKRSLFSES